MTPGRLFAVWALLLNGAMAGALTAAMLFGVRPVTVLDALIVVTLVVGLIGAVAVAIEAPLRDATDAATAPGPDETAQIGAGAERRFGSIDEQRAIPMRPATPSSAPPAAVEDLDAFLPERPQRQRR